MPRKATNTAAASGEPAQPRRSSRIMGQPKEEIVPKQTPKRAKRTDKEKQPKAPRGKKRKAEEEELNGDADDTDVPAEKKVRFFLPCSRGS